MNATSEFDVVIAGGGLIGGSLAIALAQTSANVALIEAVEPESAAQPSFDDRTIALSRGSCQILQQLDVWKSLAGQVWPIHTIHISEQGRFGTAMIAAEEQGLQELGFVIKSRALGHTLWAHVRSLPQITTYCPARAAATAMSDTDGSRCVELTQADGSTESIQTRLLVVADGARSGLREILGIAANERDYEQVAIVANIAIDPAHAGNTAYERFTPEGPLAVLPGEGGRYTVVLARAADTADAVLALPDEEFIELLQQAFGFRLGRFGQLGRRYAYPLQLITTQRLTAERAVVLGNAAHGLHPVAGQGFNLGLRDVAGLAELIADGIAEKPASFDAGSPLLLDAYQDWRRDDQRKVVAFTDGLIRLFGMPGSGVSMARGIGLTLFDLLPGAKQEMARQTMGLAGRLSRLARGLRL